MNPFNPDRAVEVEDGDDDIPGDPTIARLVSHITTLQDRLKKAKEDQAALLAKATSEIGLKVDTLAGELRKALGETQSSVSERIEKLDGSNSSVQKALEARLEAISDAHFRVEGLVRDLRQKPLELPANGAEKPASVPTQPQPDAGAAMLAQLMEQMKAMQPPPRKKVVRFEVERDDHARAKRLIPIYEE